MGDDAVRGGGAVKGLLMEQPAVNIADISHRHPDCDNRLDGSQPRENSSRHFLYLSRPNCWTVGYPSGCVGISVSLESPISMTDGIHRRNLQSTHINYSLLGRSASLPTLLPRFLIGREVERDEE